jgi:acetyl/propionyl-CoA carboxylase alpha subunit
LPTNIKFLRRTLAIEEFQRGDYDTSFISKHEETLLRATRKKSHYRRGTIAIVTVFLDTLRMRSERASYLDPWLQRDMFRLNHRSLRPVELVDDEDGSTEILLVEYLKENCFNAYYKDENGFLVSILLEAEVEMNPDRPDDIIVRTKSETFKVDFYMDQEDKVTQLDYEGAPLNIYVKPKKLVT